MKTKLLSVLTVVCLFSILSCDRKQDNSTLNITVDDIQSFHIVDRNIVFTNAMYEKIMIGDYDRLTFCFDNKPLFEDIRLEWQSGFGWESVPIPVDYVLLLTRYGGGNGQEYDFRLIIDIQKIEVEWDVFIKCIRDAGKLVTPPPPPPPVKLTVDDIKSYNMTTFEIVFTDLGYGKLMTENDLPRMDISFYLEDKLLFENITVRGGVHSFPLNDLVLIWGGKFYLADGFPVCIYSYGLEDQEMLRKEREENTKKREVNWNLFIKSLSDAGKIVRDTLELTVDDIQSYNLNTFEIVLAESATNKLRSSDYLTLSLFFEGRPLLKNICVVDQWRSISSRVINDLVFVIDPWEEIKYYLAHGLPFDSETSRYWHAGVKEEMLRERNENDRNREVEWVIFIKYLSDAGKMIY